MGTKTTEAVRVPLLLDGEHAGLSAFTSGRTDTRWILRGIHYRAAAKRLEATDGSILAMLPVETAEEYPEIDVPGAPDQDTILPVKALVKAAKDTPSKSEKPILNRNFVCGRSNGQITCASTDLETVNKTCAPVVEGHFPDVDACLPGADEKPMLEIGFSAHVLANLAGYAISHSNDKWSEWGDKILFQFYGPERGATFQIKTRGGRMLTGMIMPLERGEKE